MLVDLVNLWTFAYHCFTFLIFYFVYKKLIETTLSIKILLCIYYRFVYVIGFVFYNKIVICTTANNNIFNNTYNNYNYFYYYNTIVNLYIWKNFFFILY